MEICPFVRIAITSLKGSFLWHDLERPFSTYGLWCSAQTVKTSAIRRISVRETCVSLKSCVPNWGLPLKPPYITALLFWRVQLGPQYALVSQTADVIFFQSERGSDGGKVWRGSFARLELLSSAFRHNGDWVPPLNPSILFRRDARGIFIVLLIMSPWCRQASSSRIVVHLIAVEIPKWGRGESLLS